MAKKCRIGMNSVGGNNPCGTKSKTRMNLAGGNNPCGTEKPDRDASDRGEIIPAEQKSKIEMHLTSC